MKHMIFLLIAGFSSWGFAKGGGSGFSVGIALATPSQSDLEAHIARVNQVETQSISKFGAGLEFFGDFDWHLGSSDFYLILRPSYFTQSTSSGAYKYSLSGLTFFPMLRFVALENNIIKFFLQGGVGYGKLSGTVEQSANKLEFSGGTFGAMGGLGALFCFTASHCMGVEGNLRYLPITRNTVTSVTGTPTQFSQITTDGELEFDNSDVGTSMSGIVGAVYYTMIF
jgi:hypothetical protein